MYEYRCKVLKVIDGDTVDIDIDLGFGTWIRNERVRIMGIDTPESRTSNLIEKKFGLAAKSRLQELLGETAILKTQVSKKGEDMKGKFGRILGNFATEDGRNCADILCEEGHAVTYFGGAKEDIQKQHMTNRKKLVKQGIVEGAIE
jgi:micrococcal nuclease